MRDFLNIPISDKEIENKSSAINTKRFGINAVVNTEPKSPPKMKEWPEDPCAVLSYNNLIDPIKNVLKKAYRFIRHEEIKNFEYDGFNIGKADRRSCPSPQFRFSEKAVEFDNKRGTKVIDIALNIVFLFGVEQGRRLEKRSHRPVDAVKEALVSYRNSNKELRIKLDELEVMLDLKDSHPTASIEEFNGLLAKGIKSRRDERLSFLKEELAIDPVRSNFDPPDIVKLPFKSLTKLMDSLQNDCCTDRWKEILIDHGWTYVEWLAKCEKKKIKSLY
jgi:hypothetical protein